MADALKAQKLAAAKKKLKEYQQKSQKPSKTVPEIEENLIAFENLSNSTHSSITDNFECSTVPLESVKPSPFQNYFNENHTSHTFTETNSFFDNLQENSNSLLGNSNLAVGVKENDQLPVINHYFLDNNNEIKQNDEQICKESEAEQHCIMSAEDAKKLSDYLEHSKSCNKDEEALNVGVEEEKDSDLVIENLLKTSSAMKFSSNDVDLQTFGSLEVDNNQELNALLDLERSKSKSLQTQLEENINRVASLENELRQNKIDWENRLSRELGPLQEQLQYHTQTFGILVAEKTDLMASLSQSQLTVKQKIIDCEELCGRLKTSRSRVADLERDLQLLKSEKENFLKNHNCKEENEKILKEFQDLLEKKDDISQELLETREKLNLKVNENLSLQRELQETTHQLSLAQVKITQITAGESLQVESQVEVLNQQKLILEKQLLELNDALKATTNERDQASIQYQHYVQQLNGQVTALASKLESVTLENESFSKREQNLVKHIGDLEKHLQNVQEEQLNFAGGKSTVNEIKKQLDVALETTQNLEKDKAKLTENYRDVLNEKEELLQELEQKKILLEQLDSQVERLQGNQPDSVKLLAEIESDKVAASRAVKQNTLLKQQLDEIQQAFVKSCNDKLELAERLTSEEYRNKELTAKVALIQKQLHTLTEALTIKDNELTHMRDTSQQQNKQIMMQDQLSDRLRHYEAQFGSVQAIQNELQESQNLIQQLRQENLQLQQNLSNQQTNLSPTVILPQNHSEKINSESQTISDTIDTTSENQFDREVAMKRLEEKFTRTMQDIANLSEEKQRLEHIVTQLQGETETIGEYIALYQHQRGILKQRTQEKDEQLKRLAEDRQKVRTKLDALNSLVKKLMIEKGGFTPEMLEQHSSLNSYEKELCSEHAKMQQEMGEIGKTVSTENGTTKIDNTNVSAETAEEIISLLAEIKACNLIQPSDSSENFHPCSWCSGQLLTV